MGNTTSRANGFPRQQEEEILAASHVLKNTFPGIRPERANYLVNFSQRWRYLYLETPKVACSSIKRMLQRLELAPHGEVPEDMHDRDQSPLMAPYDSLPGFLAAQHDPRYVRFSFVRNPFTRMLSCYLEKFVQSEWERARLATELGLPTDRVPSFKEFLLAVREQDTWDMDIHWLPQATILQGLNQPSFIGRFERFPEDFARFGRVVTGQADMVVEQHAAHATGADQRVAELMGNEERELIVEIYAADFERFCYSTDPRFAG